MARARKAEAIGAGVAFGHGKKARKVVGRFGALSFEGIGQALASAHNFPWRRGG
jgi:hypothetical protein